MGSNDSNENYKEGLDDLQWITLRKDMDEVMQTETLSHKFNRKFSENPIVPIGCGITAIILSIGIYNFLTGNKKMSQHMMRARVVAQGLTVAALVGGIFMGASKMK